MEARNMVLLMDHNYHIHREYKRNVDGTTQLHRSFNSRSKKECARLVKVEKSYKYIDPLMALAMRFAVYGTPIEVMLPSFDPKTIAPTIRGAGYISSPTELLFKKHLSRF
jgi:hypothetical protein